MHSAYYPVSPQKSILHTQKRSRFFVRFVTFLFLFSLLSISFVHLLMCARTRKGRQGYPSRRCEPKLKICKDNLIPAVAIRPKRRRRKDKALTG